MIIEHTLAACDCGLFDQLILVVAEKFVGKMTDLAHGYKTPIRVVAGGNSRKASCVAGVNCISDKEALVVIHNGVQPFVTKEGFQRCLAGLKTHQAVTSGVPCVYTVMRVNERREVEEVPDRATLCNDMGVEGFRMSLLRKLFAGYDDDISTDIIGMVFRSGLAKVLIIEGDVRNIKITHRQDVVLANRFLKEKNK